ncbi:MAG TPA: cytidine deaminase [Candidatus Eisenbacteria bacterium]|nr:cytidine deaminase [Candidatus Eisenbacteria bacterium]
MPTKLTPEVEKVLWSAAEEAAARAYAPYSGFHVGAALLTSEGEIASGCNVENASYGLTNCAERTAVFRAIAEGKLAKGVSIAAIAVVHRDHQSCTPCGACRQVLSEFGMNAVVLYEFDGERRQTTVSALLPESFQL